MLDMYDEPRFEPLEASTFFDDGASSRPLVAGTVARGDLREDEAFYTGKVDGKYVTELPVELDRALLLRGQERFNIYCSPCHGRVGDGNGMIVQRGFRRPPSFVSTDRLLRSPVGHFYDVISNGFGAMPSYASRVEPRDRWAIVAYIRALERSQNGTLDDVPPAERDNIVEREDVQEAQQRKREAAEKLDVERQRRLQRDIREHRRSPEEGREKQRELERQNGAQESDLKEDDKETRRQGNKGKQEKVILSSSASTLIHALVSSPSDKETKRQGDKERSCFSSRFRLRVPLVSLSPCPLVIERAGGAPLHGRPPRTKHRYHTRLLVSLRTQNASPNIGGRV